MIGAEAGAPSREGAGDLGPHALPAFELDGMALTVVETDRLDAREPVERVGEADGGILSAREQHQSSVVAFRCQSNTTTRKGQFKSSC